MYTIQLKKISDLINTQFDHDRSQFLYTIIKEIFTASMTKKEYSEDKSSEIIEDAFVNIKEACMRLQERTKCGNDVVIKILNDVTEFYISQNKENKN